MTQKHNRHCVTSIYYHHSMRNLENTKISSFKFLNKKNKQEHEGMCITRAQENLHKERKTLRKLNVIFFFCYNSFDKCRSEEK